MSVASLGAALALGFFGSTHCIVMCGGIAGALSGGLVPLEPSAHRAKSRALARVVAYNAGRIVSYAIAGAIVGGLGALLDRFGAVRDAQLGLRLFAGATLVVVGLAFFASSRGLAFVERLGAPLWKRIEPHARRLLGKRTVTSALGLGALWGWMPCGLVYAALGLALGAGSVGGGAMTMLAFGVGTAPMLLGVGGLASHLRSLTRARWLRQVAALAIVVSGTFHVAEAWAQMHAPEPTHACCAHAHSPR